MAHLDQTIRQTRRTLQTLAGPGLNEELLPDLERGVTMPAADAPLVIPGEGPG